MGKKQAVGVRLTDRTIRLLDEIASDKGADRSTIMAAILQQYTEKFAMAKQANRETHVER